MDDCWKLVASVLGKSRRVLLYGPPGTGKTYLLADRIIRLLKKGSIKKL